jgi:ring-1,2-phenylacetyl-CoA epoxidase subunit PaaA
MPTPSTPKPTRRRSARRRCFNASSKPRRARALCHSTQRRAQGQDAIDRYFPLLPAFFGQTGSGNNALYRKFGIKQRSNEEMRTDDIARARALVEDELELKLPAAAAA